jgi:ketosteroid isomerase-like protein
MILSKPSKIFLLVACVALADVRAADVDLEKAVGSLIAAEKAYAKLAGEKGFRDASISVFADDAVIFTPNAVNGKKFWRDAKEDPAITWRPIFASISRSGELGYTTGPSEYRKSRAAEKPDGFGHFITVWRKDAKGVWRVALDVGVNHPQPQEAETEIRTSIPDSPLVHPESANVEMDKVQSQFAESLKDDEADAIIDHASDDVRVYRRDQLPAVGKTAAEKMLADEDAKTSRAPLGAGTSHPIDLAYEYGEYTSERDKVTQRGIYLTIWRLESDGSWKIALDLQKSAPVERKP